MKRTQPECHDGFNLLRLRPIRALIHWRGFPHVFQVLLLGVFIWLAAKAWGIAAPPEVGAKLFAKSNLTTLLVWGVWWPAMVWIAVLFGRVWCMVCPLELLSKVSERVAAGLGWPQRPLRRWISSGSIIVVLYAVIQLLVAGAQIHRVPAYTAFFLAGLLALAILTGLFFKDRALCRGFCPVGLLLGTYGRGGMLAVRAGDPSPCRARIDRCGVATSIRTRIDTRSCPSLLNPARLNSNRDCLVCGHCIRVCAPDKMQLLLRRPFAASDARETLASWPVTLFVMLVSGFVVWELCTEWPAAEKHFLAIPAGVASRLDWPGAAGWLKGGWALAIVPLALWLSLAGLVRLLGEKDRLDLFWRRLALPMVIVIAAGHMSKGLAKLVTWVPFLPRAVRDPDGITSSQSIVSNNLPAPSGLLSLPAVAMVGILLVLAALFCALREHRLTHRETVPSRRAVTPLYVMAAGSLVVIAGWALG